MILIVQTQAHLAHNNKRFRKSQYQHRWVTWFKSNYHQGDSVRFATWSNHTDHVIVKNVRDVSESLIIIVDGLVAVLAN